MLFLVIVQQINKDDTLYPIAGVTIDVALQTFCNLNEYKPITSFMLGFCTNRCGTKTLHVPTRSCEAKTSDEQDDINITIFPFNEKGINLSFLTN